MFVLFTTRVVLIMKMRNIRYKLANLGRRNKTEVTDGATKVLVLAANSIQ